MSDGMFNMDAFSNADNGGVKIDESTDVAKLAANIIDENADQGNKGQDDNKQDDLNEGGSGNANPDDDENKGDSAKEVKVDPPAEVPVIDAATLAKIKESGYESIDALLEAAKKPAVEAPKIEPTPEELERNRQLDRANFLNYAIKESNLSDQYINRVETLRNTPSTEVVFDSWKADYLKVNDGADEDDAKYAFESLYNINSKDELLKQKGQELLDLQKDKIISAEATQYDQAVSDFMELKTITKEQPAFEKLIGDTFTEVIKDFELGNGEEKTNFKSAITKDQILKAVNEQFGKEFLYNLFNVQLDGQKDMVKKVLSVVGKLVHKDLVFDAAVISHGETMRSVGARSAALGSKNAFNKNSNTAKVETGEEDRSGLQSTFG